MGEGEGERDFVVGKSGKKGEMWTKRGGLRGKGEARAPEIGDEKKEKKGKKKKKIQWNSSDMIPSCWIWH